MCKSLLVKCGFTRTGKQRFKCNVCRVVRCRRRLDLKQRNVASLKRRWMLGMNSLSDLAKEFKIHRTTLSRRFTQTKTILKKIPPKKLPTELVIVLDGTAISKQKILSLAYEKISDRPLAWSFDTRESYSSWRELLLVIKQHFKVFAIVSDGQKGLKKAIKEIFPNAHHQRCMTHVIRLSLTRLTKNPQTKAGEDLRDLVLILSKVKVQIDADVWKKLFELWNQYYDPFLNEKSLNLFTNRKHFTHRRLRSVRSLIKNALPDLFHFLQDGRIPNTTNVVEGGINSPISELIKRQRGITNEQKELLVSDYLRLRRKRNLSTRNAT